MLIPIALATLATTTGADLVPNYAATLLPPYEDSDTKARLVPARRTRPIRVGVIPRPGMVTDERLNLVRAACAKWATATRATLGLRFAFVPWRRPGDAEIVFYFGTMTPGGTLKGMTTEQKGWARIDLAVEDSGRVSLPWQNVLRVATHEIGHALGIWGHSPDPHDMMSLDPAAGEITLSDVNTLRIAYGG